MVLTEYIRVVEMEPTPTCKNVHIWVSLNADRIYIR